jgi:hypothetical protein
VKTQRVLFTTTARAFHEQKHANLPHSFIHTFLEGLKYMGSAAGSIQTTKFKTRSLLPQLVEHC